MLRIHCVSLNLFFLLVFHCTKSQKHHTFPLWGGCIWCESVPLLPLKIRGETVETFIAEAQDKSRNALMKSLEAGFNAFCEQLSNDEMQFDQAQLLNPV